MYNFSDIKIVDNDFPNITKDYQELDEYDGYPLLYLGKNKYEAYMIGSLVEIDYENNMARYFQTPIDRETYLKYINKIIPYKEILISASFIFVIDVTQDDELIYEIKPCNLPMEYIPCDDSFCPKEYYNDENISVLLHKNDSTNQVYYEDFIIIVQTLDEAMGNILSLFNEGKKYSKRDGYHLNILAQKPGSYEIICDIGFNENYKPFFGDEITELKTIFNRFLNYIINIYPKDLVLTKEVEKISQNIIKELQLDRFKLDVTKISKVLAKSYTELANLKSSLSEEYQEIVFSTPKEQIGIINDNFVKSYSAISDTALELMGKLTKDSIPKQYNIRVYSMNAESRKVSAYCWNDERFDKVKVHIPGNETLSHTDFSHSLHSGDTIKIKAIATRIDDKITELTVI